MIVNIELGKSGEWLKASKLSLNIEKAKYTFLQKFRAIKRTIVIKFLAYWFIFEKKLTKNIGVQNTCWTSHLETIYFSYIHLYLNYYVNIA